MRGGLSYRKQSEPETGLPGEARFHLDRKTSLSAPNALNLTTPYPKGAGILGSLGLLM